MAAESGPIRRVVEDSVAEAEIKKLNIFLVQIFSQVKGFSQTHLIAKSESDMTMRERDRQRERKRQTEREKETDRERERERER